MSIIQLQAAAVPVATRPAAHSHRTAGRPLRTNRLRRMECFYPQPNTTAPALGAAIEKVARDGRLAHFPAIARDIQLAAGTRSEHSRAHAKETARILLRSSRNGMSAFSSAAQRA
jgi:hypothetical protein